MHFDWYQTERHNKAAINRGLEDDASTINTLFIDLELVKHIVIEVFNGLD